METLFKAMSPPKRTVIPSAASAEPGSVLGRLSTAGRGGRHETCSATSEGARPLRPPRCPRPTSSDSPAVSGREAEDEAAQLAAVLGQRAVGVLGRRNRAEAEEHRQQVGQEGHGREVVLQQRGGEDERQAGDERRRVRPHADGDQDGQPHHAGEGGELTGLERRLRQGQQPAADPGDQGGDRHRR